MNEFENTGYDLPVEHNERNEDLKRTSEEEIFLEEMKCQDRNAYVAMSMITSCDECGGNKFQYYHDSDGKYHVTCINIPRIKSTSKKLKGTSAVKDQYYCGWHISF